MVKEMDLDISDFRVEKQEEQSFKILTVHKVGNTSIGLYRNPDSNRLGAQLIFTSHDLSTMSSELFRRDEIWFVAKGNQENSKLYSLVEFKVNGKSVRKDAKFDKQYLEGKYGAFMIKIASHRNILMGLEFGLKP